MGSESCVFTRNLLLSSGLGLGALRADSCGTGSCGEEIGGKQKHFNWWRELVGSNPLSRHCGLVRAFGESRAEKKADTELWEAASVSSRFGEKSCFFHSGGCAWEMRTELINGKNSQ